MRFNRGGWRFWRAESGGADQDESHGTLESASNDQAGNGEKKREGIGEASVGGGMQERANDHSAEQDLEDGEDPDKDADDSGLDALEIAELLHAVKGSVVLSVLTGLFLTGFVILGEGTVSFQHAAAAAGGYGALFTWFYVSGRRAREVRPAPWRVRSAMLPDARLLLLLGPLIIAGWELDGALREAVPALLVSGAWLGAMADGWVLGLFAGGGCTLGGALRVLCADISNDWRER